MYENIPIRTHFWPILQEGTIEVEMQTVGRKFLRGHDPGHGERKNGDQSLEIRHKIQTILQKHMLGNKKLATVREKCIASQDRQRENGDRPSEMRPIMRTVRQ